MAEEGEGHRLAVADLIDDQAEQDDADRERPEPHPVDLADLGLARGYILRPRTPTICERMMKPNAVATIDAKQAQNRSFSFMPGDSAGRSRTLA